MKWILLAIYVGGVLALIKTYSDPDREDKYVLAYRFGYIIFALTWPVFVVVKWKRIVQIWKES